MPTGRAASRSACTHHTHPDQPCGCGRDHDRQASIVSPSLYPRSTCIHGRKIIVLLTESVENWVVTGSSQIFGEHLIPIFMRIGVSCLNMAAVILKLTKNLGTNIQLSTDSALVPRVTIFLSWILNPELHLFSCSGRHICTFAHLLPQTLALNL